MSLRTGLHRIAAAIRFMGAGLGGLIMLGTIWAVKSASAGSDVAENRMTYMAVAFVAAGVVYGAARGIAWIVEGFAPGE